MTVKSKMHIKMDGIKANALVSDKREMAFLFKFHGLCYEIYRRRFFYVSFDPQNFFLSGAAWI